MTKQILQEWKNSTKKLAEIFVTKRYGKKLIPCMFWSEGLNGEKMLIVSDDFWSISDMVNYLESMKVKKKICEKEPKIKMPTANADFRKYDDIIDITHGKSF